MNKKKPHSGRSKASDDQSKPQGPDQEAQRAAHEVRAHAFPVPVREELLAYLKTQPAPAGVDAILKHFDLSLPEEEEGIRRRLRAMCRDGQLMQADRGCYTSVQEAAYYEGYVQATREGFGFLIREDGGKDIYLSPRQMQMVFNDDRVRVRLAQGEGGRRRRQEGVIIEVLERHTHQLVGAYEYENGVHAVRSFDRSMGKPIPLQGKPSFQVQPGEYVLAEIIEQPTRHAPAKAVITEVLGSQLTPGLEMQLAIFSHELPAQWSKAVLKQADAIPNTIDLSVVDAREDWRKLPFVTIDGADAKDYDDAVFCKPHASGWELRVAIADVSHYIKPGTPLDEEALERGNSVYFPSAVIPMLPERLSNGICSLCPDEDRCVLVCVMQIDQEGTIVRVRFDDAVIRSQARLTYDEARDLHALPALSDWPEHRAFFHDHLQALVDCYHALRHNRETRGAIDFDTTETKMLFDDAGKICGFKPLQRHHMHRLIEECMLAANTSAAKYLMDANKPALFRNHEQPEAEKIASVRDFLKSFGLRLEGKEEPSGKDYMLLMQQLKDRPDAQLIQTVLLRSLKQAHFSPDHDGHFGLAYEQYCQFTSPIRRYPDLIVHRALRSLSKSKKHPYAYDHAKLLEVGEHCSLTERRADRATRDALDWLKCHYMQHKVGQAFEGVITDVTSFGLFIQLKEAYIEGLCHISQLPNDYFVHDPVNHRLVGDRGGQSFQLGDAVRIVVANVNLDLRRIEFVLDQPEDAGRSHARRPSKSSRSNKQRAGQGSQSGSRGAPKASQNEGGGKPKPKKKPRRKKNNAKPKKDPS
jgi:ribonuclease R